MGIIEIKNVTKSFGNETSALNSISLTINDGEIIALIGPSGSGKSTLLRAISGLVKTDTGTIAALGEITQDNGKISSNIRNLRQKIGFIFQQFNLVERLPVFTNVLSGSLGKISPFRSLFGLFSAHEKQQAFMALKRVGLDHRIWQRTSTLSGGQKQRIAIARALMQKAEIILADEPVSSLDPESTQRVLDLLKTINTEDKTTLVICLHQIPYALEYCDRIVCLKEGHIIYDGLSKDTDENFLRSLYADGNQLIRSAA